MRYQLNSIVSTLIDKPEAKKGSIGAIIGVKDDSYLVEIFVGSKIPHIQLFYQENQIYRIENE